MHAAVVSNFKGHKGQYAHFYWSYRAS